MKNIKIISSVLVLIIIIVTITVFNYYSDISSINSVDVEIEDVDIRDLKLASCDLNLKLKITNPTSSNINDLTAEFDVFISNTDVGDGLLNKVTLPSKSYESSDVFITIYYSNVGQAVINGLQTGNFNLSIQGEAKLNILFNLISITEPFSASYSYSSY